MEQKRVKMKDIAQRLGVSTVTVSKAINNKDGVSNELKQKIITTAEEMGYHMNLKAKAMKTGLSYNMGIVIPSYFFQKNNNFYLYYFKCLLDCLNDYNYYGILQVLSSKQQSQLRLPRFCMENSVDGVIFLGQVSRSYIVTVQGAGYPVVLSDFYENIPGINAVVADNYYSSYDLTNYLFRKGHTKIGFVGKISATSSIQDRYLGYQKSMLEHGLTIRDDWVIVDRDEENRIYQEFLLPEDMPTAFVCNSDEVGYLFIKFLQSNGYSVPEDCSVVSFDNTIFSQISEPRLTTLETNVAEMARLTVEKIIAYTRGKSSNGSTSYANGTILERNSVCNLTI